MVKTKTKVELSKLMMMLKTLLDVFLSQASTRLIRGSTAQPSCVRQGRRGGLTKCFRRVSYLYFMKENRKISLAPKYCVGQGRRGGEDLPNVFGVQ